MNPFKGFKTMWEAKFGSRVQHPTSTAYHDGIVSQAELRGLRRLSRLIFREPVEVVPATPFTLGPTTNDFKPGYAKRRVERVLAEEQAKAAVDDKVYISSFPEHWFSPR